MKPVFFLLLMLVANSAKADTCLNLTGVVQDYATHKPLEATFFIKTSNGRVRVGQSALGSGRFSLVVNCQATALIVERAGYRPQQLLLTGNATGKAVYPTGLLIPLVAIDQPTSNRPYEQSEQRHYEQQTGTSDEQGPQRGLFVVTDALSQTQLRVQACFFSTNGQPKRCFDTNTQGQFEIAFPQRDIIAVEIQKSGYQPYQGNIVIEQLDGQKRRHDIRLMRELTVAVVQFGVNQPGNRCELQGSVGMAVVQLAPVPGTEGQYCSYNLMPGQYQLVVSDATGSTSHRQPLLIRAGLNVLSLVEKSAGKSISTSSGSTTGSVSANPVSTRRVYRLPDELPLLYFDQGSYLLDDDDRDMLRQVGAFMKIHPEYKLKLIGHTDPEGDERMNRYLAEFRAKMIANYLFWEGVPNARITLSGQGSRYPVSPSDSEENKAKNRRVFLKLEISE